MTDGQTPEGGKSGPDLSDAAGAPAPNAVATHSIAAEAATPEETAIGAAQDGAAPESGVDEPPRHSSGRSFAALAGGGVLAAIIGAGAAIWTLPNLPPQVAAALLPARPDDGSAQALADQKAQIAALTQQVQGLRQSAGAASAPAPDLSGVQAALDQNAAAIRTVQDGLKALDARLAALESRPAAATGGGADTGALQGQIAALTERVAAVTPEAIRAQTDAAVAEAETRIKQSEADFARLQAEAADAVKRSIAQSAVARLAAAFDAGAPLAPALADAQTAGLTIPPALNADAPTLTAVQIAFPEAAREALAAARKALAGGGFGDRVQAFLLTQTGARSVAPREGTDPDAVLSRAQAAVDAGDLARALTEIDALPQAGKDALRGWTALAQARVAAAAALADLSASMN